MAAYIREKDYGVDPEAFVAFYESKGWMVGKTPMTSWRAALTTWERKDHAAEFKAEREAERQREAWERSFYGEGEDDPC